MKNKITEYVTKLNNQGVNTSSIIQESGVGRTQFYEVMNGNCVPRLDTANKIAKALKVDIKDLFPELKEDIKMYIPKVAMITGNRNNEPVATINGKKFTLISGFFSVFGIRRTTFTKYWIRN